MKTRLISFLILPFILAGCIGDDIIFDEVDAALRYSQWVDTLGVNDVFQFEARYTNQIGQIEEPPISWTSSDSSVLSVDQTGLAMGITKGQALLICKVETADQPAVSDTAWVVVDDETGMVGQVTERVGALQTTSSYVLEGSFKLRAEGTDLVLELNDDYKASSSLPGLYVYLTNNPNSVSGAFEIGAVTTFSGTHSYDISGIDISEYGYVLYFCKPFGVKVGDGKFQN